MGSVYTFTCPRCEYRARVSGGTEEGYHCVTRTILCRDCQRLHDVAVRVRVAETTETLEKSRLLPTRADNLPPMLLFGRPPRTRWQEHPLRCPVSDTHRIEVWSRPGKCPRCGTLVEQDVLPYRIWD